MKAIQVFEGDGIDPNAVHVKARWIVSYVPEDGIKIYITWPGRTEFRTNVVTQALQMPYEEAVRLRDLTNNALRRDKRTPNCLVERLRGPA